MKNGTRSNRSFPNPNRAKASAAVRSNWIAARCSTRSATRSDLVVRGGSCPRILVPGKRSTVTFASGAKIGLGPLFTIPCATGLRKTEGRKVAPTAAIIDSQSVKTPDQAGESGYDAGKKIKGRKTPLGSGHAGTRAGHYDHQCRHPGPRRGQEFDRNAGPMVWAAANHLGRWRLLGRAGPVGKNNCGPSADCIWKSCGGVTGSGVSRFCPSAGLSSEPSAGCTNRDACAPTMRCGWIIARR